MEDMAKYCDELFVLAKGKLILQGNCKEVFSEGELLRSAGLDVPEIYGVVRAMRHKGVDISKYIYTVNGAVDAIAELLEGGVR